MTLNPNLLPSRIGLLGLLGWHHAWQKRSLPNISVSKKSLMCVSEPSLAFPPGAKCKCVEG